MMHEHQANGSLPTTFGKLDNAERALLTAVREHIVDESLRARFDEVVTQLNKDANAKVRNYLEIFFSRHQKELLAVLEEADLTISVDANGYISTDSHTARTLDAQAVATAITCMYKKEGKILEERGGSGLAVG